MLGKTTCQVEQERDLLVKELKSKGHTILDTSITQDPPDNNKAMWYLGQSILFLSQAEAAYFMPGWENTRDCSIEHEIARDYNMLILAD